MKALAAAALVLAGCATDAGTPVPDRPVHHVREGFRNVPRPPSAEWWEIALDRIRLAVLPNPDAVLKATESTSRQARAAWDALGNADGFAWIGHATVLLRLGGTTILTDPMFGAYASPVAGVGPRRLVPPGIALEDLPRIDVVLVSHDHYDHFDPDSIRRLTSRDRILCLFPLRVGGKDEFGCARAERVDWGSRKRFGDVTLHLLPAQHDSGRRLLDRNRTLWGSWLMERRGRRVYFAGDTGPGPHFARIGASHGPIDLAILPVAAYEPRSVNRYVHLDPEGAVSAFRQLRARRMLAVHWGTFALGTDDAFAARRDVARAAADAQLPPERVLVIEPGAVRRF
jgi:L-ascorbate metabolism protein UlaG (beta-lactamase superfamily)